MKKQSLVLFQKRDDLDELEGFQQQELAKVKHMVRMCGFDLQHSLTNSFPFFALTGKLQMSLEEFLEFEKVHGRWFSGTFSICWLDGMDFYFTLVCTKTFNSNIFALTRIFFFFMSNSCWRRRKNWARWSGSSSRRRLRFNQQSLDCLRLIGNFDPYNSSTRRAVDWIPSSR